MQHPPYIDHPLDYPLDFALDTAADVATFNDTLAKIARLNPLIATDSRLINPANAGRPIPQGTVLDWDGATQYANSSYMLPVSTSFTYSEWLKKAVAATAKVFVDARDAAGDGVRVTSTNAGEFLFEINGTQIKSASGFNDDSWYFVEATYDGATMTLKVDGVTEASAAETSTINTSTMVRVGARSFSTAISLFKGQRQDLKINGRHWDLRHDGKSAIGGSALTLVNNPSVVTMVTPVDPANERGMTDAGGGVVILARADNPAIDVDGNPTQYPQSAYPVEPNITGGTAEALTAFNTNVAIGGVQPPAIANAGLPATWVQLDGSVPLLQVKDNGDSTSSLALGLPVAPTTEGQESIDKYHG